MYYNHDYYGRGDGGGAVPDTRLSDLLTTLPPPFEVNMSPVSSSLLLLTAGAADTGVFGSVTCDTTKEPPRHFHLSKQT